MGFVDKETGVFNQHEYNWPVPTTARTAVSPAFHVETSEDIKRKKLQSQSEIAVSHSPYFTPEQRGGNQSKLRTGNVGQLFGIPKFQNVKVKRYTDLKLCESNWVKYLNSIQLGIFSVTNPFVQDVAAGSKPSDSDIKKAYDDLINNYNKKPFDPIDPTYVDGNGQVSTRKNSTLSNAKSNPSLPTWDQFYASIKSVTSYYEDILNKNKSSGVTINPSQTDAALKKQLSDAESLAAKLVADNTKLQGNIDTLQSIIDKMKIDLANKIAQRYNSSSTTVDSSVYTESDLNINYAISNSDIASWQDISRQASGVTILDDLGLSINTQSTLSKMAQDAKDASSTEPDVTGNPLLNYSSNIVTIELPGPTSNTVDLRSRDIPMMHCNAKNEDTVASLKLVKYSMTIADNTQATSSEVRDALAYGKQTDLSNPGIIDLFETSNFMLQAASETDAEKVQIIDNFGAPQLFMFGRRPRVYNYSGYLWNNKNNNWKNEFRVLYDKYLRGTSCVDNGIKCLLTYDRSVRSGYILNCSINQISDMEMAVSFNFSMFVEDEKELVDESIFSTTDPSIQNAFSLANQQALAVESERDIARKAIEKKLTVDKPVITATTTKPDPGSLEMPPMTSTTIPMVAPKNAPTLTAQEAFKPSKYELNKPFNLYPAIQNTSDTTTQNTKASKAAIMGDSITAFTLGGPGAAIYYTISKAMTGNK